MLTSCIRLSVCLEGVPVTQPRCHGDQSHSFICTFFVCSSCEDFFSLQKNQNDKQAVMVSLFRAISLSARRRHWLSSEELTTDNMFLHVRADTCIRDFSSITAIVLRLRRSPVLRLVDVVVWLHIATEMASSWRSARKEYSLQGNSQAQRQTQNTSCNMNSIFPAREPKILQQRKVRLRDCRQGPLLLPRQGSAHSLSHIHAIAETLSQATMITTITMSIRHPFGSAFFG